MIGALKTNWERGNLFDARRKIAGSLARLAKEGRCGTLSQPCLNPSHPFYPSRPWSNSWTQYLTRARNWLA